MTRGCKFAVCGGKGVVTFVVGDLGKLECLAGEMCGNLEVGNGWIFFYQNLDNWILRFLVVCGLR